jgi:hypothetical protein
VNETEQVGMIMNKCEKQFASLNEKAQG